MYVYDEYDQRIIEDRVKQFRDQTRRYLAGELSEEEFRPLRLQNGLYIQRFAPMLRVAVPYGQLTSRQTRMMAKIARDYDKGYAHISTRQNVQFNWPAVEDIPDILAELATVQMHAIQTSGNCLRNVTTDQFAGVAADEVIDPRPWCEIVRQWTTFHPEFAYLPRKFKIAVNGSTADRAAIEVHDIGLEPVHNAAGELGFRVLVGGGLGRTPVVGAFINEFLPWQDLLSYLDAILRVYNRYGRRDNKYKARIKILVKALTPEVFAQKVDAEMEHLRGGQTTLTDAELQRVAKHFVDPDYKALDNQTAQLAELDKEHPGFARWRTRNTLAHKKPGYVAVTLSLKPTGVAPGDITDKQLDAVADLADRYSFGQLRTSHEQNIILADVEQSQLFTLWGELREGGFATPNIGLLTDIICCPGGDFCSLANAKSIPIAESIQRRFDDLDYLFDIGELDLNISGCMNACGHHHVGHIGILGVDKKGEEFYQVSLGGSASRDASLGKILGPSFAQEAMPDVISKLIDVYVEQRTEDERFIDTYQRIGIDLLRNASMQRIIKNNEVVDETWHLLPKDFNIDEISNCDDLIVPLQLWREHSRMLKARDGGLGVWLDADEEAEEIGEDVAEFQVIALNFPAFTDGRNYSNARLLRDRYGFKGELRAIGDVLRDQLFYMHRCGFDAFAVRADKDPYEALEGLKDFSVTYQAATDEPLPLFRRR
jgi:sulfite reductase (NADPH) hemoprotein beta-component